MALTVIVPAASTISALANVPATEFSQTIIVPAAATITAIANVPTTTDTDIRYVFQAGQTFPAAGPRDAPNNFGGGLSFFQLQEEVTLDTVGLSSGTTFVIPPGALVAQVTARVTEAITGASTWEVGTFVDTAKYIPTDSNVALGYTTTNQESFNPNGSLSPIITTQLGVYITTDAPATAGKIRVGVAGFFFVPFTS